MNTEMVVRAWEDPIYRAGLAPEILASLPTNPAGSSVDELDKAELSDVLGAASSPWAAKTNKCGSAQVGCTILCSVLCNSVAIC